VDWQFVCVVFLNNLLIFKLFKDAVATTETSSSELEGYHDSVISKNSEGSCLDMLEITLAAFMKIVREFYMKTVKVSGYSMILQFYWTSLISLTLRLRSTLPSSGFIFSIFSSLRIANILSTVTCYRFEIGISFPARYWIVFTTTPRSTLGPTHSPTQ
jgi:hypothetical protein